VVPAVNGQVRPLPTPAAAAAPFRVGLFSDGQLRIEWRGQIVELEREQTEELVRFLDRLGAEG